MTTRNADLALARGIDNDATLAETWDANGLADGEHLTLIATDGSRGLHLTRSEGSYWVGDDGVDALDTCPLPGDEFVSTVCDDWRESVTVACGGSLIDDCDDEE